MEDTIDRIFVVEKMDGLFVRRPRSPFPATYLRCIHSQDTNHHRIAHQLVPV